MRTGVSRTRLHFTSSGAAAKRAIAGWAKTALSARGTLSPACHSRQRRVHAICWRAIRSYSASQLGRHVLVAKVVGEPRAPFGRPAGRAAPGSAASCADRDRPTRSTLCGGSRNPGLVGDHDFARAVDVVADHRLAGDQRLRRARGPALRASWRGRRCPSRDQLGNPLGRHQSGELEIRSQVPRGEPAPRIVSDNSPSPTNRNRTFGSLGDDSLRPRAPRTRGL